MLTYKRSDYLEVIGYSNSDYANCMDTSHGCMELKYLAIKEEVQKRRVSIEHISTNFMIANPLIKRLNPKVFSEHVERMGTLQENWQ